MSERERVLTPPDLDVAVPCRGETHWIAVRGGVPARSDAHGIEEAVLTALGGEPPPCVRLARMVTEAPAQLANVERVRLHARGGRPRNMSAVAAAVARREREPRIDPDEVPMPLLRLGKLWFLRTSKTVDNDWARIVSTEILYRARTIVDAPGIKLLVGDAVELRLRGERPTVVLARDWLARVAALGLEEHEGRLVTDAAARRDGVRLTVLEPDRPRLVEVDVPRPPDVRLPAEVRA